MIAEAPVSNVVWRPIPPKLDAETGIYHPSSQALALAAPTDIVCHAGARGPGKSAAQYMDYRKHVNKGYGKYWRGLILDRQEVSLNDLVAQTKREFPKFDDGAKFHESNGNRKWVWPGGEELLFRHVNRDVDYEKYHGWEIPWIGWNEITKYPTRFLYDKFMSINRWSFNPEEDTPYVLDAEGNRHYLTANGKPLPNLRMRVFITTNPNGPGHNWVKEEFVDPKPPGVIHRVEVEWENQITGETEKEERSQIYLFGNFDENPFLPNSYRANIIKSCEADPNLYEAWVKGNWDVSAGGALDDLWVADRHIIDRFPIPDNWYVDRSMDWGSSKPYCVLWWAEANGEEVTLLSGKKICPQPGTLFCIYELYGSDGVRNSNKGNKRSSVDVARDILEVEENLRKNFWVTGQVNDGPADNSIGKVEDSSSDTTEKFMLDEGVGWEKSDKSKGSREIGLELFRIRLRNANKNEGPGVFFFRNCQNVIRTCPGLPRDEKNSDDVDTEAEDHAYDTARYRFIASDNRIAKSIRTTLGR